MLPLPATDGRSVKEVQVDNFLVRVFVPADGTAPEGDLRGLVRHVASGTETPFCSDEEVLDLLRRGTARDGDAARWRARR